MFYGFSLHIYIDLTREFTDVRLALHQLRAEMMLPSNTGEIQFKERLHQDARWLLVKRITASSLFKPSARLCKFLLYVSECAIRGVPEEATEQQIGVSVFGRRPGYNSNEDSIVRSHARLLRQKLATYFAEEGKTETLRIEIPKGHYVPVFHPYPEDKDAAAGPAAVEQQTNEQSLQPPSPQPQPVARLPRNWKLWGRRAAWAIVPVILAAGFLAWYVSSRPIQPPSPVIAFWRPFLTGEPPIMIYSNALFQGDSTNGLRNAALLGSKDAEKGPFVDTYTGVGELTSVYTLTKLFDSQKANFVLKRSRLVTWDVAQMSNLIFIGAPAENPSLSALPATTDFAIAAQSDSAGVANLHPKPGEPASYSRPERPLTSDYAILALLPGMQSDKRVLIFSGLTTFGTQAAVEYVCRPESAAELLKKITGPKGEIRPFEAVLQTKIVGGVPVQTSMVSIRVH